MEQCLWQNNNNIKELDLIAEKSFKTKKRQENKLLNAALKTKALNIINLRYFLFVDHGNNLYYKFYNYINIVSLLEKLLKDI